MIAATLSGAAACKSESAVEPEEAAERMAELFPGVPLDVCEQTIRDCAAICASAYPDSSAVCLEERSNLRSFAQEACVECAERQLEGDGVTFTGAMNTDADVPWTGAMTTEAGGYGSDDAAAVGTGDDGAASETMSTGMGMDAEGNVTVTEGSQKDPPNQ